MKARHPGLLLLVFLIMITLTGCWGRREPEDLGFVVATAFDRGEQKRFRVTVAVAVPANTPANEGGSKGPAVIIESAEGDSILRALDDLNTRLSRRLVHYHNKVLVLSREVVDPEHLPRLVEVLTRFREYRRDMLLILTPKDPVALLRANPLLEANAADYVRNLSTLVQPTGFFPTTTLHHFLVSYESKGTVPILPISEVVRGMPNSGTDTSGGAGQGGGGGGSRVEMAGTAVLKGNEVAGLLGRRESRLLMILRGDVRAPIQYEVEGLEGRGSLLVVRLFQESPPEYSIQGTTGNPSVEIRVKLDADLQEVVEEAARPVTAARVRRLEVLLAEDLEREMTRLIRRLQREFQADALGLGWQFRRRFPTLEAWREYDWSTRFPEVPLGVEVKVNIRRGGMTFEPIEPLKPD